MATNLPLILQIQQDCLDNNISVSSILRKAKVAAFKLELKDFLNWINSELEGYSGNIDDLPEYRKFYGSPKALNPYHGWMPILSDNPDFMRIISSVPVGQAIGPLEDLISKKGGNGNLIFPYPPEIRAKIANLLEFQTDIHIQVYSTSVVNILDSVRNIILDWTLKLEKANVLGEGMNFKQQEKEKADNLTQHFYAKNIGFAGQIRDQANVHNVQNVNNYEFSLDHIRSFLQQAKNEIAKLPSEIQNEAKKSFSDLDKEIIKTNPDRTKLRSLLSSIKNTCEGATGNLVAQGISSMIQSILGG